MISKPRHLTWDNLKHIHQGKLKNEPICYTWKADGYLTKIYFDQENMYLKIHSEKKETLKEKLENLDFTQLNLDSSIKDIKDVVLYGEYVNVSYFIRKLFIFDIKYPSKYGYIDRSKAITDIINLINKTRISSKIEITVKEYDTHHIPYTINYSSENFEYAPGAHAKSDGIIIYYHHLCFKLKYQNTYDVWLENKSGKLFSEDNYFLGYLGYCNSNFDMKSDKFQLVEVSKYPCNNFYKLEKIRSDKKRGDTLKVIKQIDNINPSLLKYQYSMRFLRHLPQMQLNNKRLLTFEYRVFKEEMLTSYFYTLPKNCRQINWLDIGCGNIHDLNTFLYLKYRFKKLFLKHKNITSNIYLADLNLDPKIYQQVRNNQINQDDLNYVKLLEGDIYSTKMYSQIPQQSLDLITIFLSINDFNNKLFRNLNYWLKPTGKIIVIYYDSTCIPNQGVFSLEYNFGLKHLNDEYISVFRNGQRKWTPEKKIDFVKIKKEFNLYNYKILRMYNNSGLDDHLHLSEMIWGLIFKKDFEKSSLYKILSNDLIQSNIVKFLDFYDYSNLQILFPQINWIVKNIDNDCHNRDDDTIIDIKDKIDHDLYFSYSHIDSDISDFYYNSSDLEYWS